jgi:hypothetical protein
MSALERSIEKFLERWSQRKRAAAQPAPGQEAAGPHSSAASSATSASPPEFDPASLPPIESINAASDLRAFLAAGVPPGLARAALRRAWVTDPAIRDFIGIAENQWDFTRPDGVPGFGSLDLDPALRRLVSELFGDRGEAEPGKPEPGCDDSGRPVLLERTQTSAGSTVAPPSIAPTPSQDGPDVSDPDSATAAADKDADSHHGSAPKRTVTRKHGGALPV